ncbi:hypothetical protein BZA77DRAFT_124383 [Pyronema omphalodes]|nr:hypothetical protein BZA77DRAFT_124383 [Pyronema omphalodes]
MVGRPRGSGRGGFRGKGKRGGSNPRGTSATAAATAADVAADAATDIHQPQAQQVLPTEAPDISTPQEAAYNQQPQPQIHHQTQQQDIISGTATPTTAPTNTPNSPGLSGYLGTPGLASPSNGIRNEDVTEESNIAYEQHHHHQLDTPLESRAASQDEPEDAEEGDLEDEEDEEDEDDENAAEDSGAAAKGTARGRPGGRGRAKTRGGRTNRGNNRGGTGSRGAAAAAGGRGGSKRGGSKRGGGGGASANRAGRGGKSSVASSVPASPSVADTQAPATAKTSRGATAGSGSRGGRGGYKNKKLLIRDANEELENELATGTNSDVSILQPDWSVFEAYIQDKDIMSRREYKQVIRESVKVMNIEDIRKRQSELQQFFREGANMLRAQNIAHVKRSYGAIHRASDEDIMNSSWYQAIREEMEHLENKRIARLEREFRVREEQETRVYINQVDWKKSIFEVKFYDLMEEAIIGFIRSGEDIRELFATRDPYLLQLCLDRTGLENPADITREDLIEAFEYTDGRDRNMFDYPQIRTRTNFSYTDRRVLPTATSLLRAKMATLASMSQWEAPPVEGEFSFDVRKNGNDAEAADSTMLDTPDVNPSVKNAEVPVTQGTKRKRTGASSGTKKRQKTAPNSQTSYVAFDVPEMEPEDDGNENYDPDMVAAYYLASQPALTYNTVFDYAFNPNNPAQFLRRNMARRTTRENRAIEGLSLLKSNGKSTVVFKPADSSEQDHPDSTHHQDADMTDRHSSSEDEEEDDIEDIDDEVEDMEGIEDDLEDDMLDDDPMDEDSVVQTMPPTPIDDPVEKEPVVVMDQEALSTRTNQEDKHENQVVNGQEHIPAASITIAPQQADQHHEYTQQTSQQILPTSLNGSSTESTIGTPLQPSSGNNAPIDTSDESRELQGKKRGRLRDSKFKDGEINGVQQHQIKQSSQTMRSSPPIAALGTQTIQHQQTPELPSQQHQPPAYQSQGTSSPAPVQGSQHVSPIPHPGSIPRPTAQQHRQPTPSRDAVWPRSFTGQIPMPQPYSRPPSQGISSQQPGVVHQPPVQQPAQNQQPQTTPQPQPATVTKYYLGNGRWHEGPPPTEGMVAPPPPLPHVSQAPQLQPYQTTIPTATATTTAVSAIPTPGVIPASNGKAKDPLL